jgi:predicted alpha/beta superfamily hydrolase
VSECNTASQRDGHFTRAASTHGVFMPSQAPRLGHAAPTRMHLATAAGLATLIAATLPAQPSRNAPEPIGTREPLLTVTRVHVPSRAFETTRDVFIWMPDAESATAARYPVLIFPDAEETGQFRAALANVQFLIDRRLIPPMIVAGVPFLKNRMHELSPAATGSTAKNYPNAGGADQTLQFMIDELLPWIDAHYPTMPVRLFAGHSLGGLLALYAMDTRPDVFRVVIAMSPAVYWNDGTFANEVAHRLAADTVRPRTLFVMSGARSRLSMSRPLRSRRT